MEPTSRIPISNFDQTQSLQFDQNKNQISSTNHKNFQIFKSISIAFAILSAISFTGAIASQFIPGAQLAFIPLLIIGAISAVASLVFYAVANKINTTTTNHTQLPLNNIAEEHPIPEINKQESDFSKENKTNKQENSFKEKKIESKQIINQKVQKMDSAISDNKQIGVKSFAYFVGGVDNFEKLPVLDFNTLGELSAWQGSSGYPDSISIEALSKIDSDIIRGTNGINNYEYLIVKYKDHKNYPGIFVLFCHNETGQFGGCKIHGSGNAFNLDELIYGLMPEDSTDQTICSKENFKKLFTNGIISGTNSSFQHKIKVSLKST
jgi:hypothetical protein